MKRVALIICLHTPFGGKHYLTPVDNTTYRETCGACHFVYQPELLPSASWEKILAQLYDHFGEAIELDPESIRIIADAGTG